MTLPTEETATFGDTSNGESRHQSDDESMQSRDSSGGPLVPLPLPRDHSYLTASHPLLGNDQNLRHSGHRDAASPFFDLAIFELFGVVLFPGSTIPVKLRDRSLIEYLGKQIEICRELPHLQSQVRLGILTFQGSRRNRSETPLMGRVGTIATIKYTHERTDDNISSDSLNSSHVWRRYQETNELVFTAVGTHRFRIVGTSSSQQDYGNKIFRVEQMNDEPLCLPPIQRFFSSPPELRRTTKQADEAPHNNIQIRHQYRAWCLSSITPIPYFVYQKTSCWRIVSEIVTTLDENEGRNHLPSLGEISRETLAEPTKFSFWCSSNMPFSESDRLSFLEADTTYERLCMIFAKVSLLSRRKNYICCNTCEAKLSSVESVFTVGGAEGATSAYVNEHGYIHQITTLRRVEVREIFLQGPASTENSYFPGYSWTICYCSSCASLLGWMFQRVETVSQITEDRPKIFFGFMSSNVILRELSGAVSDNEDDDDEGSG